MSRCGSPLSYTHTFATPHAVSDAELDGHLATALTAARTDEALAALLTAWACARAPEVTALVEAASAIAARGRPPIIGASQRALHEAWLAVEAEGDPADVERLLATLAHGNLNQVHARIQHLATRPPDPRIAVRLEELLASPPSLAFVKGTSNFLWDAAFAELARIADPRTKSIDERLPWLAHERARSPFDAGPKRGRTETAVARVAQAIAPAPSLSPATLARCAELAALLRTRPVAPTDRGAELLSQIYAQPHDLAARTVYGDWLATIGDPRGEFIALQLARRDGDAVSTRERALLRTHQSVWLGKLGAAIEHPTFERGFVASAHVAGNVQLSALAIPEASTLERLVIATTHHDDGSLLAKPPFHGLVAVSGLGWPAVAELASAAAGCSIRTLEVRDDTALPPDPSYLDTEHFLLDALELQTGRQDQSPPSANRVLAFLRTRVVRRLRRLAIAYTIRNDAAFVRGYLDAEIGALALDTWSWLHDLAVERSPGGAPRTRIVVRYDNHPSNRGPIEPLLRQRAATWPRDLVPTAVLDLDERYAEHPDERDRILDAARGLATELIVTVTAAPPRRRSR